MVKNKIFWFTLLCISTLLSGCLAKDVQSALGQVLSNTPGLSGYGIPQRGYSSANRSPQRAYSSKNGVGSAAGVIGVQGFSCLQDIDPAEMDKFSAQANNLQAEIKTLCDQGQRDKAMKRAIAFNKRMASNKVMQKMKKCGETAGPLSPAIYNPHDKTRHVCDSY